MDPIRFDTDPARYRRWRLTLDSGVATLTLDVPEDAGLRPGYALKLNSYDLAVDIELCDAVQRLRFEHPEVRALVITSGNERVFCAGANIGMLAASSHGFKVNFCKFTNETRLSLESLARESGIATVAALNGTTSGGGYELALACDWLLLQDDGSSAVSLPEVPLLGVLPGTGGLTRLVDKRRVRRDRADVFCTLVEGIRGERALAWGLVDEVAPRGQFPRAVEAAVRRIAKPESERRGAGVPLPALEARRTARGTSYRFVEVALDPERRVATLTVRGPDAALPTTAEGLRALGAEAWPLRAFRELEDALLDLRFNHATLGLLVLKTQGDGAAVAAADATLHELAKTDWFAREIQGQMRRTLKRLDVTARSVFAVIEPGSCFTGSLLELALAADRSTMLCVDGDDPTLALSPANFGALRMGNGLTRLETRFLGDPDAVEALRRREGPVDAKTAEALGLVTFAPDALDWDDELRVMLEERASFSPDALTGMEASLRFAGPETLETKIFARLSAWQNWIFNRPNALGPRGAVTTYGKPERAEFDFERV